MVDGMATKKYTVTLPEEPAEEIRSEVGPGAFSAYVTRAIERQREHDRLGELVTWMQEKDGPLTKDIADEAIRLLREAGLHGHKYAKDAALAAVAHRQTGRTALFTSDVDDLGKLCRPRVQLRGL